jgi:glycerate-2-kinase
LHVVAGDHPVPGARSFAGGLAIAATTSLVRPGDDVLVMLSGGATSLVASPVDGVSQAALIELFEGLLRSGAPIATMNTVRKRVLRWGAGRLAAAMPGARLHCYIASDVLGDDLAAIGSGPCVADPFSASDLIALAEHAGLWAGLPAEVRAVIQATALGELPETPKPGDRTFDRVDSQVILNNAVALDGIVAEADALGVSPVVVAPSALEGEACAAGDVIGRAASSWRDAVRDSLGDEGRACAIWGGETTVRWRAESGGRGGRGGRCQELALAAAWSLRESIGVSVLAAGTDGRDGPTDAAGAMVDGGTWERIVAHGVDPRRALDEHDSYRALDAAGALLRTGLTGTNVNDVIIAVVERVERD